MNQQRQIRNKRVLYATHNKGKLQEASVFASSLDITLLSLDDVGLQLDVDETGDTYRDNALLKAVAYANALQDSSLIVIADDSGIEIPALQNEPGVHSRRWKGYVMTDQEIIDYTLHRLNGLYGKDRDAQFVAELAVIVPQREPQFFRDTMNCRVVENLPENTVINGFPYRSLMYIPEIDKMLYQIHGTTIESRGGFMTHREKALARAFKYIAKF